jgi:hypothetical protein
MAHGERIPMDQVLSSLHASFGSNLKSIDPAFVPQVDKIDLQSRMISEVRDQLLSHYCSGPVQRTICEDLLDEVFSDFSLALYFCASGLIVPSQMSTRRAFEIGLAAIYLWDLPHAYWGWKNKDDDLSFSAMVAHLNSIGYMEYLKQVHGAESIDTICKQKEFQEIYRELSNTVHGKTSNLPPLSPARFSLDDSQSFVNQQFKLIQRAQAAILRMIFGRFVQLEEKVQEAMPQILRK